MKNSGFRRPGSLALVLLALSSTCYVACLDDRDENEGGFGPAGGGGAGGAAAGKAGAGAGGKADAGSAGDADVVGEAGVGGTGG